MIGLPEELLKSFNELEGHDFLSAVVVGFDHHGFESVGLALAVRAVLRESLNCVLPFVFERVI